MAARPEVERSATPRFLPLVEVITAQAADVRPRVRAWGTVVPRAETRIVPEVAGRVVWVSPDLVAGGFVREDQPLLRIDDTNYRIARERAEAAVERARSELALARAQLERVRSLRRETVASQAALDEARNRARAAEAALRDATAALERAELDLERTEIRAPFAGRVRSEQVAVGQYLTPGSPVAQIYSTDAVEVPLPVPPDELAFLDVPLGKPPEQPVAVRLRAELAGRRVEWRGRIVRTGAEIDPRSRVVTLVARVDDPFHLTGGGDGPPLLVGLFVEAEIEGPVLPGVIVLPREVLRSGNRVLVVDEEDRLRIREVEIIRTERERVLIRSGVRPGDRVCRTLLEVYTDGMRVRVAAAGRKAGKKTG